MSEPQESRKVSADELLQIRERQWRPLAESASLAAETLDQIPAKRREQTLKVLGRLRMRMGSGDASERLLRRYPAVHVLATAGLAADRYERATFWPKLAEVAGITLDSEFQKDWGDAFLDNLRRLGLPTFDRDSDAGSRYVGRILLHAGMPTYCLGDFFRMLSQKRRSTPGLTPEGFVSWAAAKAAGAGFTDVDMPVQRFVRYGDEFAVDVVDRSMELLDAIAIGASGNDIPLPARFSSVAQQLNEHRRLEHVASSVALPAAKVDLCPRLVLDPFGQGLLLRLPPVGEAPDGRAVWAVAFDDESLKVPTESLWPGSTEPAPQTDIAVAKPVRSASVAILGREHLQLPLIVIDDKDPLLAFGDDCELIPRGLPLPARRVWLLFPGTPESLTPSGRIQMVSESPLPPRWSGFCLLQVDLSDATAVSVAGSTRTVRKLDTALIEAVQSVAGVRTTSGLPVLAEPPRIEIPASMSQADWDVTLLDADGEIVAKQKVAGGGDPNAIWSSVSRPIVGSYTLRVRGPWGRGANRSFTVVEGLSAVFSPGWRRFVPRGLQPCVSSVRAAAGVELSRNQLEFDERQREHVLRVSARSQYRSLSVTPPHMTVAYQAEHFTVSPSIRPLALIRDDVREFPGEVVLDIGVDAEPSLHVMANHNAVQSLKPRGGRAGVYRFDLAEIVDTLADYPQVSLSLSERGELVIANLRPRTLFTGVELAGNELVLTDCVAVEGLCAYLFATRAPWREPECVPVVDGRAALPGWMIDAGPIRVTARIEDPWVPLPAPGWPMPGKSRLIEADGWIVDGDPEEKAISRFLAGFISEPVEVIDFSRLWTVRSLLRSLALGGREAEIADAIDTEIYGNPAAALSALTGSEAPSDAIPSLMIRSGLAWANLADAHENSAPPWTVRGALPAALLSAADSLWSDDEIDAAIGVCGDAVNGLLDGIDPYASAGRMDDSADLLDQNPALRERFIREARLVPQGLLSGDSRVLAAMDLVTQRKDPRLEWLMRHARSVLKEAERLMRMIGDTATLNAFDARRDRSKLDGWHAVPAISMALALAARHASRGHSASIQWVAREQRPWADLAAVVPQLVTIDLIIAELIVGRRAKEAETAE